MKSKRNLKKKLNVLEFNHFKEKLIISFFIFIININDYIRKFYKSYGD